MIRAGAARVLLNWDDSMSMRAGLGVGATVVALVLTGGCTNGERSSLTSTTGEIATGAPPTAVELRWIGKLGYWHDVVTTQAIGGCVQLFDDEVGPAPTSRLREIGADARGACADLVRGLADERRALAAGDDSAIAGANELIQQSQAALGATAVRAGAFAPNPGKRLPRIASPSPRSRIDPYLTRVATSVVGAPVEVRCWSTEDWRRLSGLQESLAFATERAAHFATGYCSRLVRLRTDVDPTNEDDADLLGTFAHEVEHLEGNGDEDVTECYAMQKMDGVGSALGIAPTVARRLQVLYWRRLYELNPPEYSSEECRDGGAQDLDLVNSRWP
jgi:hypothetical protein